MQSRLLYQNFQHSSGSIICPIGSILLLVCDAWTECKCKCNGCRDVGGLVRYGGKNVHICTSPTKFVMSVQYANLAIVIHGE